MPISITCSACGQNFNLRDELAGRTVRCRCGRPLPVPGTAKDSLVELLDEELARPYEPPPEREAPKVFLERRRRRRGQRQAKL